MLKMEKKKQLLEEEKKSIMLVQFCDALKSDFTCIKNRRCIPTEKEMKRDK